MRQLHSGTAVRALVKQYALSLVLVAHPAAAQLMVTTVAGSGTVGTLDGPSATAQFNGPHGVAVDSQGNCYVVDTNNSSIRRISPTGVVTKIAGDGGAGYIDSYNALFGELNGPNNLVLDPTGNIYITDSGNGSIRKMPTSGGISTWAGTGRNGYQDGLGPVARFATPTGITIDGAGNLYVADASNFRIRRVDASGNVTTLAGSGVSGTTDGPAATAQFREPQGIARDAAGNLYIADRSAYRIRKLSPAGVVSTYAGTGVRGYADGPALSAQFNSPVGLAMDAGGNLYVTDRDNPRVRRIDAAGNVTTIAGTGTAGYADGPAGQAQFGLLYGLCLSSNGQELYVADGGNHRIRKISLGPLAVTPSQLEAELSLFPNPATDRVHVVVTAAVSGATMPELLDVLGRAVPMPPPTVLATNSGMEWQLDVSSLPAGIYLCRLPGKKFTLTQRLMVKY